MNPPQEHQSHAITAALITTLVIHATVAAGVLWGGWLKTVSFPATPKKEYQLVTLDLSQPPPTLAPEEPPQKPNIFVPVPPEAATPEPPKKAGPSREDTAKVKERCMAKVLILVDQGVITSGEVEKYYEEMVEAELSKLR